MFDSLARFLIITGLVFLVAGAGFYLLARSGLQIGQFPGDIRFEKGNFTCVFGLGLSIFLSILLTVVLNLLSRWLSK